MRLDKLLGTINIATRSTCPKLLSQGRITVNGTAVRSANTQVTEQDEICLDGKKLDTRLNRCLVMDKPDGVLTADEDRRFQTVMDLLPPVYRTLGCMPVGRLDKDTTGLLLMTTDGQLAHRLITPKCHVAKVYIAEVDGTLDESDIKAFREGIPLKDFTCLPAELEITEEGHGRVTVYEGKYHQVKRMFGARGKPVTRLRRVSFGPFTLPEDSEPGTWREMTEEEMDTLYEAAGMARA